MTHTPGPWQAEDVAGAGIQIKAKLPFHPYAAAGDSETRWQLAKDKAFGIFYMTPHSGNVNFTVNDEGQLSAMLCYEEWVQFPSTDWEAMQMANARLIAAAPMMLDALLEIAKGEGAYNCDRVIHAENTVAAMVALARAAIDKADVSQVTDTGN